MPNQPFKLSVKKLTKTYGAIPALIDADLDLREGEFLTLLGPSGSGKTTLLMMVAGLVEPTGGEVWIDGKLSTFLPSHLRDIGLVFQSYALFPHLTVFENVAFPLRMRNRPAADIRAEVHKALDTVQLAHTADRHPRELSGGQQQRIALARCMVYKPSIILMDEPLGALDRRLRDRMQMEIKHLHERLGITVLYVTHDQDEAMTMSDRICLMNNAKIEQVGTPEELYFAPRSLFAAEFLGDSNIVPATVVEEGEPTLARGPGGLLIRAKALAPAAAGHTVQILVRPEAISVLRQDETADNVCSAKVYETVLTGGFRRHFVEAAGGLRLSVKELTRSASGALRAGDQVRLGWDAQRSIVLADGHPS